MSWTGLPATNATDWSDEAFFTQFYDALVERQQLAALSTSTQPSVGDDVQASSRFSGLQNAISGTLAARFLNPDNPVDTVNTYDPMPTNTSFGTGDPDWLNKLNVVAASRIAVVAVDGSNNWVEVAGNRIDDLLRENTTLTLYDSSGNQLSRACTTTGARYLPGTNRTRIPTEFGFNSVSDADEVELDHQILLWSKASGMNFNGFTRKAPYENAEMLISGSDVDIVEVVGGSPSTLYLAGDQTGSIGSTVDVRFFPQAPYHSYSVTSATYDANTDRTAVEIGETLDEDAATIYGSAKSGDYIGPWLFNEMQAALQVMTICRINMDYPDELEGGGTGTGGDYSTALADASANYAFASASSNLRSSYRFQNVTDDGGDWQVEDNGGSVDYEGGNPGMPFDVEYRLYVQAWLGGGDVFEDWGNGLNEDKAVLFESGTLSANTADPTHPGVLPANESPAAVTSPAKGNQYGMRYYCHYVLRGDVTGGFSYT